MNQPIERTADPAEGSDIAHVRDSGDEGREDERRDDHLDQAQEQRRHDAEIVGDRFQARSRCRRAVVDAALLIQPTMMPSTSAITMYRVSLLAMCSPLWLTQAAASCHVKRFTAVSAGARASQ